MRTTTMTVDNVGSPDAIVADQDCDELEIFEQAQAGTTDYYVYAPRSSDTAVQIPAGAKFQFRGKYLKDQTVGYVAAVTAGSYTFAKIHRKVLG